MACLIKEVIHFALRSVKWEMVCTHIKWEMVCTHMKKIEGVAFFKKYNLPQNQGNWVGLRVPMWDVWFNCFLRLFSKHALRKPTVCAAIEPQVHICKLLNMQGDSDQTCRRTQLEACVWVFCFFLHDRSDTTDTANSAPCTDNSFRIASCLLNVFLSLS